VQSIPELKPESFQEEPAVSENTQTS
jgi:hypothetical protein